MLKNEWDELEICQNNDNENDDCIEYNECDKCPHYLKNILDKK